MCSANRTHSPGLNRGDKEHVLHKGWQGGAAGQGMWERVAREEEEHVLGTNNPGLGREEEEHILVTNSPGLNRQEE